MRRLIAALGIAAAVGVSGDRPVEAQVSGFALVAISSGNPLDGFFGPWRATPTGISIAFAALCYETVTRAKFARPVIAEIPDGTGLVGMRDLIVTAVQAKCAEDGVIVPRQAVLMPAMQLGQ